jgi:hypothetical protein
MMKDNTWHHVAWTRDGTAIEQLYIDGINIGASGRSSARDYNGTGKLWIGHYWGGEYTEAYYDEIRISKGIARYSKSIERYANTFVEKGDTGDAFSALQIQSNGAKSGTRYSDGLNRTGYNTSALTITGNPMWSTSVGDPLGGANTALYFDGAVLAPPNGSPTDVDHIGFPVIVKAEVLYPVLFKPSEYLVPLFAPFDCICSAENASPVSPFSTNVFAYLSMDLE